MAYITGSLQPGMRLSIAIPVPPLPVSGMHARPRKSPLLLRALDQCNEEYHPARHPRCIGGRDMGKQVSGASLFPAAGSRETRAGSAGLPCDLRDFALELAVLTVVLLLVEVGRQIALAAQSSRPGARRQAPHGGARSAKHACPAKITLSFISHKHFRRRRPSRDRADRGAGARGDTMEPSMPPWLAV